MKESRELGARDIQSTDASFSSPERGRSLSLDTTLSAVANEYRRAILTAVTDASEQTLEYDALVDRVVDQVRDEDAERMVDEQRQRVRIALHHTHLPKLDEAQIIDYEAETLSVQFVGGELERKILQLVESSDVHE